MTLHIIPRNINYINGTWKCLRPILGKIMIKAALQGVLFIDGRTITNSKQVANDFCDVYTDIDTN